MTLKWLSSYAPVDEEFDKVSLLLHGDGTNGSTTIVDSSSSPKAVTAVGDAQISTAQSKFGGSSLAFDGTGDYLTSAANSAFDLGSGDYTIELWVRLISASNYGGIVGKGQIGVVNSTAYSLEFDNTSNAISLWIGNNTPPSFGSYVVTGTTNIRTSAVWTHLAVSRSGNNTRLFVNGTQEGSTYTTAYTIAAGNPLWIGGGFYAPTTNNINGYIDDLRITKGVARYTANFTPPTAPFPDLSPSGRVTIEDNSLDVDARQYIINVEEQDGQPLESGVRTAINDFVVDCKSDGIWNAIKASCILAGARTLDGALVPLTGGAPTNNNFVSADYDRETGLKGDGSTKYLDSNRNANAQGQNNFHFSVFLTNAGSTNTDRAHISTPFSGISNSDLSHIRAIADNRLILRNRNANGDNNNILPSPAGSTVNFLGSNRNASNFFSFRRQSVTTNVALGRSASSFPAIDGNMAIFARLGSPASNYSNARLSFYSIGESLDLAKLDTRVSNLMTAIGAAIP